MKLNVILAVAITVLITVLVNEYMSGSHDSHVLRLFNKSSEGKLYCPKCNIILLNIDLLRADYVGLINPSQDLTPNIDQYFNNAIQFTNAISASGATYMSATATATGTEAMFNSHDFGILSKKRPGGGSWRLLSMIGREGKLLIDRIPTIAETLSANGYTTIGINDWIHSGQDVFLDRGFQDYVQMPLFGSTFAYQVKKAISELNNNTKQPFFFYIHSNALHFNFYFPENYDPQDVDLFEQMKPYTSVENDTKVIRTRKKGVTLNGAWDSYTEQLRYIDTEFRTLFKYIDERFGKNTIVVLYSHHGIGSRLHNKLGVGLPYQEFVHVPFFIRHPKINQSIQINQMVSLVDLPATLYKMVGATPLHMMNTYSLTPLLEGAPYQRKFTYTGDFQHESIRKGSWKLIFKGGMPTELYNLSDDPKEINNLFDSRLPITRELMAALYDERIRQLDYSGQLENQLKQKK